MSADNDSLTYRGKKLVRTLGTILITACCAMVVLGSTLWHDQLKGPRYILYWGWCLLLVLITIGGALFDLLMIRRVSRRKKPRMPAGM